MKKHRAPVSALLAILAPLFAACAGGEGRWAGSVTDSAGVTIVANPETGIWSGGQGWTLEEEIRIGALEGNPEYQFGEVGFLAVDSKGQLYVPDIQARHIQVYTAEGEYVRTIGKPGAGPGELQQAAFAIIGPGDTLLVPDIQNQRINRYAPDGSSLGSSRLPIEEGIPIIFRSTESGTIAEQVRPFALPGQPELEDPVDVVKTITPDGTTTDTLLTFPSGETFRLSGGAPEFNFYSPEPTWDLRDDKRLIFAVNNDYRISLFAPGGVLERVTTKPFQRRPVAERDKNALMTFLEKAWADAGVPGEVISQLRQNVHFAEFFPAFANLVAGPAGTIWVQHILPASELSDEEYEAYNPLQDTGAPEWDVFDADGRFLGVVNMPPRFTPRLFRDDKVYGVWRDELDVQYVVRMRIVGDLSAGAT
jgi:hypothetical protein